MFIPSKQEINTDFEFYQTHKENAVLTRENTKLKQHNDDLLRIIRHTIRNVSDDIGEMTQKLSVISRDIQNIGNVNLPVKTK
ncbi:hypothetical protein FACS1894187_05630 [Synergistales bacterium]|nr:hypothetical protein FACS1894187_05630 [Synergistales bacterium]